MKILTTVKLAAAAFAMSATVASAQIPAAFAADPVVLTIAADLEAQGFEIMDVRITLLGRYKIEAVSATSSREIVATRAGDVLADVTEPGVPAAGTGTDMDGDGTDDMDGSDDDGSDDDRDHGTGDGDDRDGESDHGPDGDSDEESEGETGSDD